jgi:hypothetical protein
MDAQMYTYVSECKNDKIKFKERFIGCAPVYSKYILSI